VDHSLAQTRIDCEFSGSTAVVAYLRNRTLTMAWVGDSRSCLGRQGLAGLEAVELTVDHKPTDPIEKERILK
jgi:serine/threonine protein phosphatase PrpC